MTTTTSVAVDALTELIAERQRFEGWITALDARADSVPSHIISRVRGDYSERLRGVIGKLGEFAPDLREAISGLDERLAASIAAISEREEARLEGELRSAVGEYEDERWQDLKNGLDSELATLAGERDALRSELDELRAIFAQVVPESSETAHGNAESAAAQPVRPSYVEPDAPVPSQPAPRGEASVPADVRPAEPVPPAASPSQPATPVIQDDRDELLQELSSFASQGLPSTGESAIPAASESAHADGTKTLRCQECGALNYPTEWYCERCGGELATI